MNFEKLINERFSVRSYKLKAVEEEKLNKILEAGRIAPTAKNIQPQRIKILSGAENLAKVDACTRCRFGAPLVLLICYDADLQYHNRFDDSITSGDTDAAIVVTYMMLRAWDLGIGSCWVQHFDTVKTREIFNLPKNLIPISFLTLGYATDDCTTSPNHGKRLEIKDLLI